MRALSWSRFGGALLVVTPALSLAACSHDLVLPNAPESATCGNAVVESGEECDVKSPGCVNCQVQPEWTCTATACSPVCADGVVSDASDCSHPQRNTPCDLSGYWAVRETAYLRDQVFGTVQVSSQWYLYEITQTGDAFAIDAELDCGVHVTGSATIDYPPATKKAMIWLNPEDGTDRARGQREGTSTAVGNGCAITLNPWYFVRGVETSFLPVSFAADQPLSTLTPLPTVSDPINGTVFPSGATDPTTSGIPGIGTVISGLAPGIRYAAQRTVSAFATTSNVPSGAVMFDLPGTFDVQEDVLRVTQCGSTCSLLTTLAVPATDLTPHETWQFLGLTLGSARVAPVVLAAPRVDIDLDLMTCANVQAILPHDATVPVPVDAGMDAAQ